MRIAKVVVILLLSCAAFGQSSTTSEVAALRAERDRLQMEIAQKDLLIDALLQDQFQPIKVGTKTFHSEQEFIEEFNRLVRTSAQDSIAPPMIIFTNTEDSPHIPVGTEPRFTISAPPPVFCNSSSLTAGGLVSTSTSCN
jgi:hypothetical protein